MLDALAFGRRATGSVETANEQDTPILLLIDDDSMVVRFLSHAAEECGYRAVRTTCIDGFRRGFAADPPDVIAIDLCVPGCDGIEILRQLAEQKYEGPVIIVSGMDHRVLKAAMRLGEALGLDMTEPLAKPFRLEQFTHRLESVRRKVAA